MKRVNFLLPAIFLLSSLWPGLSGAESEPAPVTVLASQVLRQDGTAQYLYKVTNKSAHPIVAIAIGADYYHGTSELNTYPLGWTADSTIPEGNTMSPLGWSPTVITTEESPYIEIEWRNDGRADIQPGQVNAGFGVIVAHPNPQYLNAHWTAIFSDATATSGQLLANGVPRLVAKLASATQIAPGRWQLSIQISNAGGGTAQHISVAHLICRTLGGTGTVSVASPSLPAAITDLSAGATTTLQLTLLVPTTVTKLSITESGTLTTASEANLAFSSAQVFYPKN
ncbi:hypothetical protein H3H36_07240 [Duganella sp. FT3S]|uniref:Uncharacterized protein n=1 Tax=Rugamonas fusca TaxID=2758568 RepID=A0A7W2EFS7_9BURK|nr:hypothetical protein [Rugamonas fusca]MBA5605154.1 hypothetical protein [Rugamonas fusca]